MDLQLQLSNREHDFRVARWRHVWVPGLVRGRVGGGKDKRIDECRKRVEFSTFDIDLEDVNERVSVLAHQALQSERRWVRIRAVLASKRIWEEMGPGTQGKVIVDLGAEPVHAEIVAVNLAVGGGGEEGGFERRFAVDTEGVDGAGGALADETIETAEPFPTVSEGADALYAVGAAEGRNKEVP